MTQPAATRPSANSIAIRYTAGFTFAYLLTTAEVVATVVALVGYALWAVIILWRV